MSNLPNIKDIYNDVEVKSKQNDLNIILNQPPKREWVKEHPFAKGVLFIPIERIEYLLTRIFLKWYVEIKEAKLIGNAVVLIVRLHYKDPISTEWDYQDGIGAQPMQTAKGAGAVDFNQLNSQAVQLAAPAAKSYAIKDAAEHIGKIFGKDLNRSDQIGYDNLASKFDNRAPVDKLRDKFILKLSEYEGEDKEQLRQMAQEKKKAGEETVEFYKELLKSMGYETS